MPKTHTWQFHVRTYEIDQYGHVNNTIYPNYLEEAATQASNAAGYSLQWYLEQGCFWLVRKWSIRYLQPAVYGDELAITTWVSDFRRVQSNREYLLTRVRDGVELLRARTNWVFVDAQTLQPRRVFPEFEEAFGVAQNQPLPDLGIHITKPILPQAGYRYTSYREVQSFELDLAKHVNNGVYFRWIEHAYNKALDSVGWGIERQISECGFSIFAAGYEVEYFKPAHAKDPIKIVSWVTEMSRVRGAWIHEIRHADSDDLLVRAYAVGAFVDISGPQPKPTRIPAAMLQAILTGQAG
jgi:acyl-CoA thioester hydrolase